MGAKDRIRVLVVDDSIVPREMLTQILESDPDIEVVGTARDGREAVGMVEELSPDLVTMDIHMPGMDGLEAIERIMAYHPTPILVVSSSVYGEGMGRAFDALRCGALEVMKKPEPREWEDLERIGRTIIRKVKVLANVRVITHVAGRRRVSRETVPFPEHRIDPDGFELIAIGSSTGGPSALLQVLGALPADFPVPIVVAQHIADGFVPGLVAWLDAGCSIRVRLAEDGASIEPGAAYLSPTGVNMEVSRGRIALSDPPRGQLYIPSADTLLTSAARGPASRALGVILTGMGADGAEGLRRMHDAGAPTIAQDEATCTVYGMPRAAVELGAVDAVLPVHEIGARLLELAAPV